MDTECPSILEQFLGNCGTLARTAIGQCYRSGSASYIENMLLRAESVLASAATRQLIVREALGSRSPEHSPILGFMQECNGAQINGGLDLFTTLSKARDAVVELAASCSAVGGSEAAGQLRTLALVLSLGQTDDHEIMSRVSFAQARRAQ